MNAITRMLVKMYAKCKYRAHCQIRHGALVHHCTFEGKNKIDSHAKVSHCQLGYGSYIGADSCFSYANFGRFCSVGDHVELISAQHPVDTFVSTSPAFYSVSHSSSLVTKQKYNEYLRDAEGKALRVGNDVWIGSHALLKGGITIGDGAVIAMGALVTHDVPPYAIVAGVPAKIIKYRFTEEERETLLRIRWWDKPIEWIKENVNAFENVTTFIDVVDK